MFFQSPSEKHTIPEEFTLAVLEMLPSVNCVKPQCALSFMTPNICVSNDLILMDQDEFGCEASSECISTSEDRRLEKIWTDSHTPKGA